MTIQSKWDDKDSSQAIQNRIDHLEQELALYREKMNDLNRLAVIIRDSNDAITLQNLDGSITAWNHGAERMYGYSAAEMLKKNISQIIPPGKKKETQDFYRKLKQGKTIEAFETQRIAKDGRIVDVWLTVTPIPDEDGAISEIATTERDITEKNRLLRGLETLSFRDDLTGLYNRRGFTVFAQKLLQLIKRRNGFALLLYMDMDNLKWINDNLGHKEGDDAICSLATILQKIFRETDVIARMGGDEFAVLTEINSDLDAVKTTVARLRKHIAEVGSFPLSVSLGTVLEHDGEISLESMLRQADDEMYKEKWKKRIDREKRAVSDVEWQVS